MDYNNEAEMYLPVSQWLERFLTVKYKNFKIQVVDSSRKSLARLIQDLSLTSFFPPEWQSWDIHVDVTAFILGKKENWISFVECKLTEINLSHLSQLLGYSRVVRPKHTFLISPKGISSSLQNLLDVYKRRDVLEFEYPESRLPNSIILGKWNEISNIIEPSSVITGDRNIIGLD